MISNVSKEDHSLNNKGRNIEQEIKIVIALINNYNSIHNFGSLFSIIAKGSGTSTWDSADSVKRRALLCPSVSQGSSSTHW